MSQIMGTKLCLVFLVAWISAILGQDIKHATVVVNGTRSLAETDDNFICATIDWWPHDKCNYNQCPWGYSSAINMNLSQPLLAKAMQAFEGIRIRIGGSLQDRVIYDVGKLNTPCHPFGKWKDGLFGFTMGCLHMSRWDELNQFFDKSRAIVTFGLNALHGRHRSWRTSWAGAWDSNNAHDFINYTISKGYKIDSWEFGNELSGTGIGASVGAEVYGRDLIKLKEIINNLYENSVSKPTLVAPGGFFDVKWYTKLLQVSGSGVVDVVTHHIYNLGPGDDPKLINKILDPNYLSKVSTTFSNLSQTLVNNGPWTSAWVGESGGAFNSGGRHVSDTFVDSFWYLDQLGLAAKYNTKVYCRQTFIGGNYGLLNKTTYVPNPDYYSALLWHRLMGKVVLDVTSDASPFLRTYAHCSKGSPGISLLLINLSNETDFVINVSNGNKLDIHTNRKSSFIESLKNKLSWIGNKASADGNLFREEYYLSPENSNLQSQTMILNGKRLRLTLEGDIPRLDPMRSQVNSPIYVAPLSIAFLVFPNFDAQVCNTN